ncbi:MAG: fimbiral protein pilA [Minicystis sp.]
MYSPPAAPPPRKGLPGWAIAVIALAVSVVVILPVFAALAIYGTRRYLAAAKTSEAKNSIGAIARNAAAAYEQETASGEHALCASAQPVPVVVPSGRKYMPSTLRGADFDQGDALTGWKCLRFSIASPVYYQYHYNVGGHWIAPANAPGPDGFEAAAQGDINANGALSTFARTGQVVGGQLKLATQIWVEDEFE